MSTLFSLDGRCALITGGSRGIGRMIAEGFVQLGVRVYITARKVEECDAAAAEMSQQGSCTSIPGDISTPEGLASVVSRLREHESSLDILVNNAGAAWGAPFDEFPEDGWDKVMDLNLKALFFLTQKLAPELRAAAAGGHHLAKVI
ncbi:MAG: SDR family NAD(P)-dependent oxidoreductase, partial [Brevibacterium aurantiacum]